MTISTYPGIEVSRWIAPTLLNNWANYGLGWAPAGYLLDSTGWVWFRGLITNSGTSISLTIFTLPIELRPLHYMYFSVISTAASPEGGEVRVSPLGNVSFNASGGSLSWQSLSGVRYRP